jgi:hypothetical protein
MKKSGLRNLVATVASYIPSIVSDGGRRVQAGSRGGLAGHALRKKSARDRANGTMKAPTKDGRMR